MGQGRSNHTAEKEIEQLDNKTKKNKKKKRLRGGYGKYRGDIGRSRN